jgi:hypothetical protein
MPSVYAFRKNGQLRRMGGKNDALLAKKNVLGYVIARTPKRKVPHEETVLRAACVLLHHGALRS